MNKKDLSERDICSKFIGPAVKRAGWDGMSELEQSRKPDFVSGFIDGMYLGPDFSKWNYMSEAQSGDQKALSALTKAETSFAAYTKKISGWSY